MIVAERTLKLRLPKSEAEIPVRIFAPTKDKDAWACGWEIHWPDRVRASTVFGFDSVQALIHALQSVGSELYASEEHKSGQLRWVESRSGYGFPVPSNIRGLLVGDDASYF